MSNLPEGLAQYLDSVNVVEYSESAGGNAFIDDMPQVPESAGVTVGFFHTGGYEADTKHPYDTPVIQVLIRGTKDARDALTLWQSIYSQLHGLRNVTLPNGIYLVDAIVIQSAPIRVGPDENGRHRYSMNLRCEVLNPTQYRS